MIGAFDVLAESVFLLALTGVLLVFVGYPAAAWLRSRGRSRAAAPAAGELPKVSLVTVARDAETRITQKVENSLGLDYPHDRLEVVLYLDGHSDGHVDGMADRLSRMDGGRVRVLGDVEHKGKAHGLNVAAQACGGDVLVFSDTDALLEPGALRALVQPFGNPSVGGVCGQRVISLEDAPLRTAQETYVEFDSWIKRLESHDGRISSNDGKLYAVRRAAFQTVDAGSTDDLYVSLGVIEQGHEFVFQPEARAHVRVPSRTPEHELQRRRRVVARSLRGLWLRRSLLNPLRFGWFAIGLFINKIVRRALPLLLAAMLLTTAWLARESVPFRLLLGAEGAACALAAADPILRRLGGKGRLYRLSTRLYYFCLGQVGTLLGLIDAFAGRRFEKWDPRKADPAPAPALASAPVLVPLLAPVLQPTRPVLTAPSAPPAFKVAYLVSVFPKLTETFVLHEILELERQGFQVEVYPLLRGKEVVRHPEVERLADRVHHQSPYSREVLIANAQLFARHPRRYLGTAFECLWRNLGGLRFFAGAVAFFPKAVWIARELSRSGVRHVHAHFAHHPALAAYVVGRLSDIPYSFTAHGSDLHTDQRMLDLKVGAAKFALTISDYNREFIRERCGTAVADKVQLLRCGVDPEVFAPVRIGAYGRPFTILCVAALREVKGHRHLIEACRRLKEQGVEFACHLVGDGPLREEIQLQVVEAGLRECVTLHGPLPRADVLRFLSQSDVVVMPSVMDADGRREGIPVVLMEAMASGLPVVASRISGIPELVQNGVSGILFPPGDARTLAAELARLGEDELLRRRLGDAGREKVMADHHQRKNVARLAELIRAGGDAK